MVQGCITHSVALNKPAQTCACAALAMQFVFCIPTNLVSPQQGPGFLTIAGYPATPSSSVSQSTDLVFSIVTHLTNDLIPTYLFRSVADSHGARIQDPKPVASVHFDAIRRRQACAVALPVGGPVRVRVEFGRFREAVDAEVVERRRDAC